MKEVNQHLIIPQKKYIVLKRIILWKYFNFSQLTLLKPAEKYLTLIFSDCFKLKKTSFECTSQQQQKFKPHYCILEYSEMLLCITFSSTPNVFKPKTENKNALYITPYLSVTLCIKTKNRKKNSTRLYDRNRKKCRSSLQAQEESTIKIKILYISFWGNFWVSVSFSISTFFLHSPIILFASIDINKHY